jgi:hypothetical protein
MGKGVDAIELLQIDQTDNRVGPAHGDVPTYACSYIMVHPKKKKIKLRKKMFRGWASGWAGGTYRPLGSISKTRRASPVSAKKSKIHSTCFVSTIQI